MRMLAATLGVAALLATSGSAARPARPASRAPVRPAAASLCAKGERVVYSCQFGRQLGSVCLGRSSVHYRFGWPGGGRGIDLASTPDWSNVHTGRNRSQGGLNQDSIRFTRGTTHYVVHAGETGSLNENPGRQFSGIVVLEGAGGEKELASLACRAHNQFRGSTFQDLGKAAPKRWDGAETSGGPFDMVY